MSGRFVGLAELAKDVNEKRMSEVWSEEIVKEILAKGLYEEGVNYFV